ncbi:hypothetical protein Tco_1109066, partial [Tanacetum coccineum]
LKEHEKSQKVKRRDQGDLKVQANAEMAQLLHQEELAELERIQRERAGKEEASIAALYNEYDDIRASIDADALFAAKLQQEEREQFTIEEREIRPAGGSRRKSLGRKRTGHKQSRESAKRQKLDDAAESDDEETTDYEQEKEELRLSLKIVPNDDDEVYYEPQSKKFPIVDFEYQLLGRLEGKDIDERFRDHPLEGYDLVHTLFINGTPMEINMLVEKKYPLIKELLEKMLNLQLEAEEENFNEWILDNCNVKEEYAKDIGNPYSRRFDEYNRVFNNEIEHLSNEYILRTGKKGYILDDEWEKCRQNNMKTDEAWHDEGYEEDEIWRSGDEKTNYEPPMSMLKLLK